MHGESQGVEIHAEVKPEYTYVVEYELTHSNTHVKLRLKDMGDSVRYSYERFDSFRGNARLVCSPQSGALKVNNHRNIGKIDLAGMHRKVQGRL